jgi:uncharacterized protein YaaN involved in tellurite resistance
LAQIQEGQCALKSDNINLTNLYDAAVKDIKDKESWP